MSELGIAERRVPRVTAPDGRGLIGRDGPSVAELFDRAPAAHRRAVATQLGLAAAAPAEEIGAMLCDPGGMARVVDRLTAQARRLAAQAAFLDEGMVQQSW